VIGAERLKPVVGVAVGVPNVKLPRVAAVVTVGNPWKPNDEVLVAAEVPKGSAPMVPDVVLGVPNAKPVCVVALGVPKVNPVDGAEVVGVPNAGTGVVLKGNPVWPVAVAGAPNDNPVCPAGVAALPNEIFPACPTLGVPNDSPVGAVVVPKVSPVVPAEETGVPNDRPV
jgi:hypothetical protein